MNAAVKLYTAATKNWRRVLGQRVSRLSAEQARSILEAHRARGQHIGDPAYRELTGGYSSQSIDTIVTRKLAIRAGILKVRA